MASQLKTAQRKALRIRSLILLFIFAAASTLTAFGATPAQKAEVTFYSNGSRQSMGAPDAKHSAFYGAIFDGPVRLATIRRGRFVTLQLPSGAHVFSASFSGRHPAKNSQLTLNLKPNGRYYIRAEAEYKGIIVVEVQKGRLDEVSCQIAQREAGATRPIQQKYIDPNAKSEIVASVSLPPCQ